LAMKGKVYLVGAGPGDPDLLTIKAAQLLESADVVLHDDLVTPAILERVSPDAQVINVGKRCGRKTLGQKEINQLMVSYASDHSTVVRLQGGDPMIFGRAAEEIAALRDAGVEFEIVPGVTSALAAAASAQVSLTDRRVSSSVIFMTGHHCAGKGHTDWPAVSVAGAAPHSTVVVYMPSDYALLAQELGAAGWPGETPCLVVSNASTARESTFHTTLAELPQAPQLPSPKLLIVGVVLCEGPRNQTLKVGKELRVSNLATRDY
jgi:uroporphyrin-III C-methyltransferase